MSNKIQFKKVTNYEVREPYEDYKGYHIVSKKNLDSNSYERNYRASILPEAGAQEEPTGLYSLFIDKDYNGSGYHDYIHIQHLNLVQEPEYNEQSRTVNAELEFAQISEPTKVFSHNYGGSFPKEFIDISMDLI